MKVFINCEAFYFILKVFFVFVRYLNFCPNFFGAGKRLGKKTKINLKICGVIKWEKYNHNSDHARHLKK